MLPPAARDRLIPADDVRMAKFACLLGQCPGRAAMQEAWGSKEEGTEILTSVTADEVWPQTSQHVSLYIYTSTLVNTWPRTFSLLQDGHWLSSDWSCGHISWLVKSLAKQMDAGYGSP